MMMFLNNKETTIFAAITIPILVGLIVIPSINAHAAISGSIDLISCDNGDIAKWHKSTLKYYIENPSNVKSSVIDAVKKGIEEWNNVGQSTYSLSQTSTKSEADIIISTYFKITPGYILGATLVNCASDANGITSATIDLGTKGLSLTGIQNVASHETGHALGLGHSNLSQDLMYPSIDKQERKSLFCPSNLDTGGLSATSSPYAVSDWSRASSC
jgi:hypothetical protein